MTDAPSLVEDEEDQEEYNFTKDESDQFKSLIQIGSLTDVITVFGHKITIATLTVAEDLEVGLLLKEYMDTHAFQRAYKTLIAAAAVKEIDGRPLVQALSIADDSATSVARKFDRMKEYYPSVIDEIFDGVKALETNLVPVLSRLGKKSA